MVDQSPFDCSWCTEQKLCVLADVLPALISYVDADLYYRFANAAYYEWFGISSSELVGRRVSEILGQETYGREEPHIRAALSGKDVDYESELDGQNGRRSRVNVKLVPDRDADGKVRGLFVLVVDITHLTRAQAELQALNTTLEERETEHSAQERILRSILDNIADGVAVADAAGNLTLFNPAAEEIIGMSAGGTAFEEWTERYGLYLPDQTTPYPGEELPLARALRGERVAETQVFMRHSTRPEGVWLSVKARPLKDDDGSSAGAVAVFRDITENKRTEKALVIYQEQLRSLASEFLMAEEQERGRLAADLHDGLGQTLTLIKMKIDLLRRSLQEDERVASLNDIGTLIDQTHASVRELTSQLSPLILHDLGLVPALQWLAEDLRSHYGIQVSLHARGDDILSERLRVLIFRTVRELLINVVKHADTRHADLFVTGDRHTFRLKVVDHGIGFDPAASLPSAETFGLFSIRERIGQLGGTVDIKTEAGKGTQVEVELPLASSDR